MCSRTFLSLFRPYYDIVAKIKEAWIEIDSYVEHVHAAIQIQALIMNLNWNIILPLAHQWVESKEKEILASGDPLSNDLKEFAYKIGIKHPERVRVLVCEAIGLIPRNLAGLTLNYGIFLRKDCASQLIIYKHELVHVLQYEQLGGTKRFLNKYINEVLNFGYPNAPMEVEARSIAATL